MEIFKDIPWYEWLYQVSNIGRIKSLKFWKERILKLSIDGWWYMFTRIYKNKKYKTVKSHRLVCIAFLWYKEWLKINHKDWNKKNNILENLEWCTHSENNLHKFRVLWYKSNFKWKKLLFKHYSRKINQYNKQWEFILLWESIIYIEQNLWINSWSICKCCKWKLKTAWWYIWKYA